jgi:hypothetical protein
MLPWVTRGTSRGTWGTKENFSIVGDGGLCIFLYPLGDPVQNLLAYTAQFLKYQDRPTLYRTREQTHIKRIDPLYIIQDFAE